MRYVIYKGKEEHVSLKEEVKYLEDYIQLQQMRLQQSLELRFEKEDRGWDTNGGAPVAHRFCRECF